MSKTQKHWVRAFFAFSMLVALDNGCTRKDLGINEPADEDVSNGRMSITNNQATLSARIQYEDQDIPLDTTVQSSPFGKTTAFRLKLRASVSPPVYGGTSLQATHVVLSGTYAYVSYNVRGATYLGGVDVFDVSNKTKPVLISQAIFQNTDVSALYYYSGNNKLYLAEATGDTGFVYPAVVEEIALSNNKLTLTSRRKGISSYAATDVNVTGTKIFATSGSGGAGTGGLTILDLTTFQQITSDLFLDARSVDIYGTTMVVMQGTPARLRTYNSTTNAFLQSYTVGGANIVESKSTVRIILDRAFIAAGDSGTRVVTFPGGQVTDSIPRAIVTGLDPSLTVTNAVSVNNDLVLMANGEAGVYVAQALVNLQTIATVATKLKLLGKMQFGSQQSANFVASSNSLIFIATGLGGLKIVEVL